MSNDTTTNSSIEEQEDESTFPLYIVIPAGILISLLIISAVVGNILTIAAFVRDKQLHTVYNIYIVNLAFTDLLMGCVSMTFYCVYTLTKYTWSFGYHFCKIYMVIDFTICLESILMMIILSLDRLLLLKHGSHYLQTETKMKAYIKICISWIIAFLLYSPAIIGWDLWTGEDTNEEGDCDVQFAYNFEFTTATAICEFVIPIVTICVLNAIIFIDIRKRRKIMAKQTTSTAPERTNLEENKPNNLVITNAKKEGQKRNESSTKRDIKAAKYLATIVLVFAVTWAPYTITTIIISFCDECVNKDAYEFLNWVLWCKASINPLIYAFNSERFRLNFHKMICCLPVCKRSVGVTQAERNMTITTQT